MILSYFIWNGSPDIFWIGSFALRWYGLLFALGFLISQQILYHIYKKEGKPVQDVDTLTIYMVLATVIGARLGHVIFYQREMFTENPLGIILPFEFSPKFRFTGLQGLASHGGAFAILFALWLYSSWSIRFSKPVSAGENKDTSATASKKRFGIFISRKHIPGQSYMQVLDRIVIVVALTGCLIRLGNFFNSEIIGKPTDSALGVVFVSKIQESLDESDRKPPIESIEIKKDETLPKGSHGNMPINIYVFFKAGVQETEARQFLVGDLKAILASRVMEDFITEPYGIPMRYELSQDNNGQFAARVKTFGIARHPAQLYESVSCLLLFAFLYRYWSRKKAATPTGRIFGLFMIILWSLRFLYEFLKENQVEFESHQFLNQGQRLSIPMIIVGIIILIYSYKSNTPKQPETAEVQKS